MAQIFISHSSKAKNLVSFLSDAFSGTKVKAVYEEFEKIMRGDISEEKIRNDIRDSNAVFILLSEEVEKLKHTRDWVTWEAGIAKENNKDIWVFEPVLNREEKPSEISVVIPSLNHYVLFLRNEPFFKYIRGIVESYDDSHVLPTALITGGSAALGSVFGPIGAIAGATIGAAISPKPTSTRPPGIQMKCANCASTYYVHHPEGLTGWRCPVCNNYLKYRA